MDMRAASPCYTGAAAEEFSRRTGIWAYPVDTRVAMKHVVGCLRSSTDQQERSERGLAELAELSTVTESFCKVDGCYFIGDFTDVASGLSSRLR